MRQTIMTEEQESKGPFERFLTLLWHVASSSSPPIASLSYLYSLHVPNNHFVPLLAY